MTREETVKIIRIICDCYPNYKSSNLSETVDVWQMMLDEYSYNQVSIALKAYVTSDTSGFAPSVGEIAAKIQLVSQPQLNDRTKMKRIVLLSPRQMLDMKMTI